YWDRAFLYRQPFSTGLELVALPVHVSSLQFRQFVEGRSERLRYFTGIHSFHCRHCAVREGPVLGRGTRPIAGEKPNLRTRRWSEPVPRLAVPTLSEIMNRDLR